MRVQLKRVFDDDRIDPRIRAAFASGEILGKVEEMTQASTWYNETNFATRDQLLEARFEMVAKVMSVMTDSQTEATAAASAGAAGRYCQGLWSKDGLMVQTLKFTSEPGGNTCKIRFVRPASDSANLPCIYYIHGGGMAMGSAFDPQYRALANMISRQGVAVACVDFRNCELPSASNPEVAPFPAGLDDCYSGLVEIHRQAGVLGIDAAKVCVAGESGGGNLTIALALKAKRLGRAGELLPRGFYSMCPYIAGCWPSDFVRTMSSPAADPDGSKGELCLGDSHITNRGLFITLPGSSSAAMGYGIDAFKSKEALAWPGFAKTKDLVGLPRCVISVNECDPLRDEGIIFFRKLLAAGVAAQCRQVNGTPHGGDLMLAAAPDIAMSTVRSLVGFVCGLDYVPQALPVPRSVDRSRL